MKILALDVSTKTGWAVFDGDMGGRCSISINTMLLVRNGLIKNPKKVHEYGKYPWCYLNATEYMAERLLELVQKEQPDAIVIEETNGSKSRYTQKVLEFLHCGILYRLVDNFKGEVAYVNSSEWRKVLGLSMSKGDKKNNRKLNVEKGLATVTGRKLDKAKLGIKGKVTKKHLAVRWVNGTYHLDMKIKDNDICDAICLGTAYIKGCNICDGK